MLASYTDEDECKCHATPRAVLEVVQVREWDGVAALKNYKNAFEIKYLGGATYHCHSDSQEDKQLWMQAIQHALDEPNRIVQDEIDDAQQQILRESEREQQAIARAAEAVQEAQRLAQVAVGYEQFMKENVTEGHQMEEKLTHIKVLYQEAQKKTAETQLALDKARHRAHDAAVNSAGDDGDDEEDRAQQHRSSASRRRASLLASELTDRVDRLAAQLEVDTTLEETHKREIDALEQRITDSNHQYAELFGKARECAEESKQLREAAASNLQQAQAAKQLSKLRIESWSSSSSHLDPLADGYLLCKHPYKPTMHRRYYVLFGNTLCWYKDADTYAALADSPSGVVHVSGVAEWAGKVGGMKVFPHAFSIITVEGKVLCCSAPTRQSVTTWTTALHIGITMPPLSPHRAVAAKSRRDSFDLLASMVALSPTKSGHFQSLKSPSSSINKDATAVVVKEEEPSRRQQLETQVVVEGYLVKKSAFVPVMKKKYCVLKGLRLFIFDSYDACQANDTSHEEIQVCSVSDWDGHGALLHYNYGFQMHTLRHQAIFCSAANNEEKDKWLHGIRASLLKHRETLLSPTRREDSMIDRARRALLRNVTQSSESETEPPKRDDDAIAVDEFRALLHEFYTEHNPSKFNDVAMLIERYKQRETALVEHLDRIYGTSLAQDESIVALLAKLAAANAKQQQQHHLVRRKSSGVKSGLVDFVKMSGYLTWNQEKCFCILSVNKLVRYASETHYETEPYDPTESVVISSVYEYPPPPDFVATASKNTFFVSYSPDDATSSPSSWDKSEANAQQQLALSAATVDKKLKWMVKIRSGLGFAHATAERSKASPWVEEGDATHPGEQRDAINPLRAKLVEYYKHQNPRKVGEVETLLSYFAGKEKQLLLDLDATYGTDVTTDPEFLAALPQAEVSGSTKRGSTRASSALYYESYLWVKHPILGIVFQRCFCVLRGETWSCYRSSHHAHADGRGGGPHVDELERSEDGDHAPLLVDVVTNFHSSAHDCKQLEKMEFAFSIETLANGPVLLRTDVARLAQDWIHLLRKVADAYQLKWQAKELKHSTEMRRRASSLVVPVGGPSRQLYDLLAMFYQVHNPDKVSEVGTLLHAFQGRERELLKEIDAIYHTKLSSDSTFQALLASVSEYQVDQKQHDDNLDAAARREKDAEALGKQDDRQILLEGYLVKRGHLIPSMRKRYCVLLKRGNTLEYYATHEDSRNPSVAPHGSFRVDTVSDWHGKTVAQVYAHGMELETLDGKTFFCAAYSAEEKHKWMHAFKHGIALVRAESHRDDPVKDNGDSNSLGNDENRQLRVERKAQLKERLVAFYCDTNPSKLADLDLLLSCYVQREFALLEAIDAAYNSRLAQDESLLALLPPSSAHARALATLQYDGTLLRSTDPQGSWRRAQSIHVAMNGLVLTFYASREGFKGGIALPSSQKSVTVLAVNDIDREATQDGASNRKTQPVYRFAVETTDHVWLYFEAPNALEKRLWIQLLHAALDSLLAQSLLEDELQVLQGSNRSSSRSRVDLVGASDEEESAVRGILRRASSTIGTEGYKGFLLVRLDFGSEAENAKKRQDASVAMEERHFVLHKHNELVVYNDVQDAIVTTFTVLSTRAWDPSGNDASNNTKRVDPKCRFPFQILTQQQIVLSCSAATDLLRAKWIKQIRRGAERAMALEMLQEQRQQAATAEAKAKDEEEVAVTPSDKSNEPEALDNASFIVKKGYLDYRCSEDAATTTTINSTAKEGFFVVTERAEMDVYADEAAFYRKETPLLSTQVCEILIVDRSSSFTSPVTQGIVKTLSSSAKRMHLHHKLFGDDAAASSTQAASGITENFPFSVQTKDKAARFVQLFPASVSEYESWAKAFRSGVGLLKGEELLADEKLILRLEEQEEEEKDAAAQDVPVGIAMDASAFVIPGAAIEGLLTPWRLTFSSPQPVSASAAFYVLVGCRLRGFVSKADLLQALSSNLISETRLSTRQGCILDADIVSIADWEPPKGAPGTKAPLPAGTGGECFVENLGFQVDIVVPPSQSKETLFFSASSYEIKHKWVLVIKHELKFALAESYLDEDAREFARQVAARMAAGSDGQNQNESSALQPRIALNGYVRVRHHFLGAIWRERFMVLHGTSAYLYPDSSAATEDDEQLERKKALEKHNLVAIAKWHPTYVSTFGSAHSSSNRYGFRVENEAGGYLECIVATEQEQTQWMKTISDAVTALSASSQLASNVMLRDAALPFIPGAAMEGYLKMKEKKSLLSFFWKTRYCVVIGTQWLLYETQEQAIASDQSGASVPPLAVYELLQVQPWAKQVTTKSSESTSSVAETDKDDDDENAARGFSVQVSTGLRIQCKAQSSLERKRWLNAMDDQLANVASANADVLQAMQHHRDKESAKSAIRTKYNQVQSDAERDANQLREALQLATMDDKDASSCSSGSSYTSSEDGGGEENADQGNNNRVRHRLGSDFIDRSPESSPMRRNTAACASFPTTSNNQTDHVEDDKHDSAGGGIQSDVSSYAIVSCFLRCFSSRPPVYAAHKKSSPGAGANVRAGRSIAPLGVPGFPMNAETWSRLYDCEYYNDDGYTSDSDW
uniref:PH domain-containing protein n=1 Tax=Globisporangium ultimum (strain ATCC 200006 / CBS 805.95 / DAOM BR144) TaxID=431595 RepID=K3WWB9_GLOUD